MTALRDAEKFDATKNGLCDASGKKCSQLDMAARIERERCLAAVEVVRSRRRGWVCGDAISGACDDIKARIEAVNVAPPKIKYSGTEAGK